MRAPRSSSRLVCQSWRATRDSEPPMRSFNKIALEPALTWMKAHGRSLAIVCRSLAPQMRPFGDLNSDIHAMTEVRVFLFQADPVFSLQ